MIKDRIVKILELKRAPKLKTFKELGVTSANFRGRAKATPINSDTLQKLYEMFPDVNLAWLLTGEGSMIAADTPVPTADTVSLDRYESVVRENERLRIASESNTTNDTTAKT